MSVNREKKNILVKICHLRGEMLWISRYRSNSTRPSSWSLQFNHFCVNLKTTGKCTKISINHVIIAHFNEMYSLRVKVQTSFVLCTPQFNSQVQTLTSLICDWWILLHVVPGSNCCHLNCDWQQFKKQQSDELWTRERTCNWKMQ